MRAREPLKIGYILAEYPSATETFVANEIRGLLDLGASVTVFALRRGRRGLAAECPAFYPGAATTRHGGCAAAARLRMAAEALRLESAAPWSLLCTLKHLGAAARFAGLVRQAGIRHLHAHFAFVPANLALMIARTEPISVSFSAHAWDVYCRGRSLRPKVRRAALCITCTEAARRHVASVARPQDRRKVVCIHHGTDLGRFAFRPREELADTPRVLAVGRLVAKKGLETLLRACNRLRERIRFCCELVGEGPLEARLKALAHELGLDDVVLFAGALPYERMPEVYARADVLAVPSVVGPDGDRDGLPNVVTEAMACGVPVVASRLSGIPEAVEDGRTGLLVAPGDDEALCEALHRMLADRSLRSGCIAAARSLVEERFDAARNSERVLEAIRSAAQQGRSE